MKTTHSTTKDELQISWHKIDADNKVLGKVATEIVHILMGKHRTNYAPYLRSADHVVVTNSSKVVLTGNKENAKMYRSHSGYIGNLREYTASQIRERVPNRLIFEAVKGMLPKNRLQKVRLANLHIFENEEHPHKAQVKD